MHIKKISQNSVRLWLDDNRNPKDPYIQKEFGSKGDEIWVRTVPEAKSYIQHGNVSFISFDNDLGDNLEEGNDLATWIEEQAFNHAISRLEWAVHTKNPVEAKNIIATMKNAEKFWDL